ncbi:MAG: hypothetical protein SYC29_09400, partial [Planctomycetota bacterium]|nr:hypothetical protein [Planctomycetota bacterium]
MRIAAPAQSRQVREDADALVRRLLAEIRLLRSEVKDLKERVAVLERGARSAPSEPAAPLRVDPNAAPPERVMLLDSFTTEHGSSEHVAQIDGLLTEAKDLEERARKAEEEVARLERYPWWGVWPHETPPSWW